MKINKRLEQIRPGLSEEEHVAITQSLVQMTAVGPMRAGQAVDLTVANFAHIRALHNLLHNNLSTADEAEVAIELGPQLELG